jgi:hypothetical protein
LTTEQLQATRAEKWRQKANPVLTLEDATEWMESTGICFFLPRKAQFPVPAPSFAEAVSGESNPTPSPEAIQNAFSLAVRLIAAGAAVPLNLLGSVTEQPDFLVSPEALPYIFSLRGDRNWKRGPGKSSQLATDIWQLLKREGALAAPELQEKLGRGVSETAVHRALSELWGGLYVVPIYAGGEATTWALFESQYQKAMHTGGGMAQATALSALISLYLDSVIAATTEDIETFLSPLAPRSRIREVARGLLAMRQLSALSLGSQSLLFITGGLPEFPAIETDIQAPAEQTVAPPFPIAEERPQQPRQPRKPFAPRPPRREPREGYPRRERKDERRPRRDAGRGGFQPQRRASQEDERREWQPRSQADQGGFRTPYRDRGEGRPEWKRREDRTERGERREWKPRPERGASRPFKKEGGFGPQKPSSREGRRPFGNRDNQERPDRREFSQNERSGDRRKKPFSKPRGEFRPESGPKKSGTKFVPKTGSKFGPKSGRRPGSKSGFAPKAGGKPWTKSGPKSGQKPGTKSGGKSPSRPFHKPSFKKRKRKDESGE